MTTVFCPLAHEAACLRAHGIDDHAEIVVTGPGRRAADALRADPERARGAILAGLAGALHGSCREGRAYGVDSVVHADRPTDARTIGGRSGPGGTGCRVVTTDQLAATPDARRALHAQCHAQLVDLETWWFVEAARALGVAVTVIRGVSDGADRRLPSWLGTLVDETGRTRPGTAAWRLCRAPHAIPALRRLQRSSARAMSEVAEQIAARF